MEEGTVSCQEFVSGSKLALSEVVKVNIEKLGRHLDKILLKKKLMKSFNVTRSFNYVPTYIQNRFLPYQKNMQYINFIIIVIIIIMVLKLTYVNIHT